jgi:hypothetical protein
LIGNDQRQWREWTHDLIFFFDWCHLFIRAIGAESILTKAHAFAMILYIGYGLDLV